MPTGALVDTSFELHLTAGNTVHGPRSAGSPFNVYLRNTHMDGGARKYAGDTSNMLVATYTVKAGDTAASGISNGSCSPVAGYDIDVLGPNGFYRSFRRRYRLACADGAYRICPARALR